MKQLKILKNIFVRTKAHKIIITYIIFVFVSGLIIFLADPGINTYREAMWYLYAVISTAGFGDVVATIFVTRSLSVLVSIYSIFVIAIATGVVVNYYGQVIELHNKETITSFMDRLENLPDMSKDELAEMSQQVKNFKRGKAN